VLIHVIAVDVVKMAIMQVVRVAVVLHRRVTARSAVRVRMAIVLLAVFSH
jgi:hypothetical protein